MKVAEYLVKKLEQLGINEFFGLPGDYNFNILTAIENNPATRWVGCTNELNAGYATDGYARIRGYGAIVTTYGVGELSAINAIAGSMAENIPVVKIVGVPDTKCIEKGSLIHHNLQDVNYNAFRQAFESVTETTAYLFGVEDAKSEIDRVLKVLVKEKKPVYIAIPSDVALLEIEDDFVEYDWTSNENNLKNVVEKIVDKINSSKKPIILGDVLVKRFDAKIEYKEFVEVSGIPVTNFLMGTNLIDMDYPLYMGGYFGKHKNNVVREYVNNSDCLISVGTVYSDLNSFGFDIPFDLREHIAIFGTCTYVEGDLYKDVKMTDVLSGITKLLNTRDERIDKCQIGYDYSNPTYQPLKGDFIYSRLQEFIKENDIVITETGLVPLGVSMMKFPSNVDLQSQILWGSIGWATPATLGVCLAKPKSRVILITGEGSHQLTAMEIGNMMRLGVKPIIIVINNKGYTIERYLCDNPDDKFNEIMQMNYSKFVRAFEGDVWSTKVETDDDFDKALKVTQIMNKLCYIEACIDKMDAPTLAKDLFKKTDKNNENIQNETKALNIKNTLNFCANLCQEFRGKLEDKLGDKLGGKFGGKFSENMSKEDTPQNDIENTLEESKSSEIEKEVKTEDVTFEIKSSDNKKNNKKGFSYETTVHKEIEE